jgi:hypothetical protein
MARASAPSGPTSRRKRARGGVQERHERLHASFVRRVGVRDARDLIAQLVDLDRVQGAQALQAHFIYCAVRLFEHEAASVEVRAFVERIVPHAPEPAAYGRDHEAMGPAGARRLRRCNRRRRRCIGFRCCCHLRRCSRLRGGGARAREDGKEQPGEPRHERTSAVRRKQAVHHLWVMSRPVAIGGAGLRR